MKKKVAYIVKITDLSIQRVENLRYRQFGHWGWKYFDGKSWIEFGRGTDIGIFDYEEDAIGWLLGEAYTRREAALKQLRFDMDLFEFAHKANADYLMRKQKQEDGI